MTEVPSGRPAGSASSIRPPSAQYNAQLSSRFCSDLDVATAAIVESARRETLCADVV